MAEPLSLETQELLDAADRAIANSRALVDKRRQMMTECERSRAAQEAGFVLRREIWKPK